MELISGPLSLFGKKVEIALAEKGIPYERTLAPFSQTAGYSPKHPRVLVHNPKGEVPVLFDGELALYDSTLIIEYLEDSHPAPPLFPRAPAERARCRLLELYADEVILASVRLLMHRNEPGARERADWGAREAAARKGEVDLAAHYAKVDRALTGEFLCRAFSAADIAVFLQFFYAQRLGGPSMKPFERTIAWYRRVRSRPAVAAVVAETLAADAQLSAPVPGAHIDGA
jgi:glutathione S-transferase